MKEDDAEHEKRRASAEKHKSVKDAEKKEKKKSLERQALEECLAKSRHEGEPEEESPDEDDSDDDDDDSDGMAARLDRAVQGQPQIDVPSSRAGASKGPQRKPYNRCQKEASSCRPRGDTPPAPTQGRVVPPLQPLLAFGPGRRVKSSMMAPLT